MLLVTGPKLVVNLGGDFELVPIADRALPEQSVVDASGPDAAHRCFIRIPYGFPSDRARLTSNQCAYGGHSTRRLQSRSL